jgi:CheY-like chemotaxis protein
MAQPPRVLLVDDDAAIRASLSAALVQRGYEVDACERGLQALVEIRAAHRRDRPFHTVILHDCLPDIDGVELLRTIEATYPDTPVLLVAGHRSAEQLEALTRSPATRLLREPFDPAELVDAIEWLTPEPSTPEAPIPVERERPTLHASAHILIELAKGVDAEAFAEAMLRLDGMCLALPVHGRWDLVALVQGMDRGSIARRIEEWAAGCPDILSLELLHVRQPLVGPELWPVLVDRAGAPGGLGEENPSADPSGDAFVLLEIEPEHLVEAYVRACLREDVVQADASRERDRLVLWMRDWRGDGHPLRVPDSLRLMPGVLRARALPIRALSAEVGP